MKITTDTEGKKPQVFTPEHEARGISHYERPRQIEASARQPRGGVNLLDENIRDDQRALLRNWRIPFRQIGREISRSGIEDEDLIPLLHRLHGATLFTQDQDFFKGHLCHNTYGLVYLDVRYIEVAEFIRRFLKLPAFNTQSKRMGTVARVWPSGVQFWQKGVRAMQTVRWEEG